MTRACGTCTLCCRLVPVRELGKKASVRCEHQRHTGCKIYRDRPLSCMAWSCSWLTGNDTMDMPRPDRAGYCIDPMTENITLGSGSGHEMIMQAVQIWCDPKRPDAWRTPEVTSFINRRALFNGLATIVRYGNEEAIVIIPGQISPTGKTIVHRGPPNFERVPEEHWQLAS